MKEKDFQVTAKHWIENEALKSGAYEFKLVHGKTIPFNALAPHQKAALLAVRRGKVYYKIPDEGRNQKPFDAFLLNQAEAYVVVMFYERGKKEFVIIDILVWNAEEEMSQRKSLTEQRAKEIGHTVHYG